MWGSTTPRSHENTGDMAGGASLQELVDELHSLVAWVRFTWFNFHSLVSYGGRNKSGPMPAC